MRHAKRVGLNSRLCEEFVMAEAKCWECGRDVPASARICPHDDCGVLNPALKSGGDSKLVSCRNKDCSHQVQEHATVCSECGVTNPGAKTYSGYAVIVAIISIIAWVIVFYGSKIL